MSQSIREGTHVAILNKVEQDVPVLLLSLIRIHAELSFRRVITVTVTSVIRLPQWANSLLGKAARCLESLLCGVLVWESQESHE